MNFAENEEVEAFNAQENCYKKAIIIAVRKSKGDAYVHFHLMDKRQDCWLDFKHIRKQTPEEYKPGYEPPGYNISPHVIDLSDDDKNDYYEAKFEKTHQEITKFRKIQEITFGPNRMKTWYFSPYPGKFGELEHLYICDYCGDYFETKEEFDAHKRITRENRPPGREIYRKGDISIFELQGRMQKYTCQCLCLLAKLFIHHKTLHFDVEGFFFYVLCQCDSNGAHIAAFISKEFVSDAGNILACIVVLPPYQKKGYGRTLISLSYELAKREKMCGTPEHPLSDLGKIAFLSFWKDAIIRLLYKERSQIHTVKDIIIRTGIMEYDVMKTLEALDFLEKDSRGLVSVVPKWDIIESYIANNQRKAQQLIDPNLLIWDPERDDFQDLGFSDISDEDIDNQQIDSN